MLLNGQIDSNQHHHSHPQQQLFFDQFQMTSSATCPTSNDPASVIKLPPIFSSPQEANQSSSLNPMPVNQALADLNGAAIYMPPATAGSNRFSLKSKLKFLI